MQYQKMWKEEVNQFLDFLHEQTISLDKKFWSKENFQTRKVMKLAWEMRSAAILHTAAEFLERDSMPPDSRITRIFIQKCVGIASGSNK